MLAILRLFPFFTATITVELPTEVALAKDYSMILTGLMFTDRLAPVSSCVLLASDLVSEVAEKFLSFIDFRNFLEHFRR